MPGQELQPVSLLLWLLLLPEWQGTPLPSLCWQKLWLPSYQLQKDSCFLSCYSCAHCESIPVPDIVVPLSPLWADKYVSSTARVKSAFRILPFFHKPVVPLHSLLAFVLRGKYLWGVSDITHCTQGTSSSLAGQQISKPCSSVSLRRQVHYHLLNGKFRGHLWKQHRV